MKVSTKDRLRRLAYLLVVMGLIATAIGSSQVISLPGSGKLIDAELRLPQGAAPRVHAREGAMITVRDEKNGHQFGLIPIINNRSGKATISSFDIIELKGGQEIRETSIQAIESGVYKKINQGKGSVDIKLNNVETDSSLKQDQSLGLRKVYGASGGGLCCVSCDSITVCANRVDMDCGSCNASGGL